MQKKYTYIITPGHGYISVSIKEIKRLNLQDKITGYSYMDLTRAYLEEDCDAGLFVEAKKKMGEPYEFVESHRNVSGFLAGGHYRPVYVNNPLKIGLKVKNADCEYTIIEIDKKIVIQNKHNRFSVPKSNPYRYITPVIK